MRPALPAPAPSPAFGFGREHHAGARPGVGSGVVVAQRDAQSAADFGQARRTNSPLRPGELYCAGERRPRRAQPVPGAARLQNGPVETGVVGGEECRAADPGTEHRPELGEVGRVFHVLPVETVNPGEREPRAGRANQVRSRQHDPAAQQAASPTAHALSRRAVAVSKSIATKVLMPIGYDRVAGAAAGPRSPEPRRTSRGGMGKFDAASGRIHRLEHHCADVAACFEVLLRSPVLRARFARAAGTDDFTDTTAARLTFLAFLHDFGKLSVGFQFQGRGPNPPAGRAPGLAGHIGAALLCFDNSDICDLLGFSRDQGCLGCWRLSSAVRNARAPRPAGTETDTHRQRTT